MLVVPVDHSFLYVEPVYLIAEDSDIPQLKRIIVSDGQRLTMEPTLEEALAAFAEAEAALREADWDALGRAMQVLKQVLAP